MVMNDKYILNDILVDTQNYYNSDELLSTMINSLRAENLKSICLVPLTKSSDLLVIAKSLMVGLDRVGLKGLLIDMSVDSPYISGCLDGFGIESFMEGKVELSDCIANIKGTNCDMIPSQGGSESMKLLYCDDYYTKFSDIKSCYDAVLVLVSPSMGFGVKIANSMDKSVLVINKATDRKKDLIAAKANLENCIGGVILTPKIKSWMDRLLKK